MDGFPFSTEIRVRFAETDAQGVAHHAAFLVWLEVARVEYLERYAGGYRAIRDQGLEALTTEVGMRYRLAAYFDDRLTVWTRCGDLRGARFRYEYAIARGDDLVAEGFTNHAVVDRATHRPTRVPQWLADAIATAESSS
ncbi:MAG TPA: thioesterase family protein [Gaiellaceae bacterium]|nr:thioesterase family protein [Gaiellaceae bacterium]